MVTRYDTGVAYVRPWSELSDAAGIAASEQQIKE
jgi:hypothetical protein